MESWVAGGYFLLSLKIQPHTPLIQISPATTRITGLYVFI
nr:MAG TPA: hypothetical protein [Caudoviricetes sp.]